MFWCYHQKKEKSGFSFRPFNSFLLFAAKRLLLHRGEGWGGADEKWTLKSLGTCQPASYTASPPCATKKAQCLGVPAEPQPYPAKHMRPSLRLAVLIFVKSISENLGGSLRTCFWLISCAADPILLAPSRVWPGRERGTRAFVGAGAGEFCCAGFSASQRQRATFLHLK